MTNKKTIKQLMAMGVQRNDAAAFTRVYRKVVQAHRRDLFPELDYPVPKIIQTAPVQTLGVSFISPRCETASDIEDMEHYIREYLAKELAAHLLQSNYVQYRYRGLITGEVEIRALLKVVQMEGGVRYG